MNESKEVFVKPQIRISEYAHESFLVEMTKRKKESLSALLEALAADLELSRKAGVSS